MVNTALWRNSGRDGCCVSNSLKTLRRILDLGNIVKKLIHCSARSFFPPVAKELKFSHGSSKFKDTVFNDSAILIAC